MFEDATPKTDRPLVCRCKQAVTVEEYDAFLKANPRIERMPDSLRNRYLRRPCNPMVGAAWYEAVAYCNWLSEQEGIPKEQWCYQPNASGEYVKEAMQPATNR